ncbi:hypothetical protein [Oscillatoria acuminata]|uniref:Uncharacterized protein n=1 Tax=Oscillatoria acuminata PCC 6304 TaxID=56110 RepID=K9TGH7_9CYAN|nr:hypothetical protein [Oscillatoria acuminata]AFY81498.1 hypothetical protein Oscil6304_1824 [Oscillatoria acuminata PCC 6304]
MARCSVVVTPLSVVLGILFSGDHYVGMFVVFAVAIVVVAAGLVYRIWKLIGHCIKCSVL